MDFDTAVLREIAASGLFDEAFYRAQRPDASRNADPLADYVMAGWREGMWPNPHFATEWYLAQNADVPAAGLNPLLHYLRHGDREGRRPVPWFDPAWYRRVYDLPDGEIALSHLLRHWTRGDALPSFEIYAAMCLGRPGASWRQAGKAALSDLCSLPTTVDLSTESELVRRSGLLDQNYYLLNSEDVLDAGVDPVEHYCRWGWREHRKPNLYFDTDWYLQTNPHVPRMGINPLVHYLLVGEPAGRRPTAYFDPFWYRNHYQVPEHRSALGDYLSRRQNRSVSPNPLFDCEWYLSQRQGKIGAWGDLFADYLHTGAKEDVSPSAGFDARAYRQSHMGRPSRRFSHLTRPELRNPLVHYLLSEYR